MSWIESHTVLLRHSKLKELARELRLRPAYVMGHLHALWHAALEQKEDGDISSWTDDLIAEYSDFPGDAPQWVRLLQKHGWLDGKILHDWLDYAGRYLSSKYRRSNPERLAGIYKKHGKELSIDDVGTDSRAKAGLKPAHLTLPNQPNQPNQKDKGRFAPPSLDEVKAYCQDRRNGIDPEAWLNYYQARGWEFKRGQSMKDWKAAVRTWEKNRGQYGSGKQGGGNRVVGAAKPTPGKFDAIDNG